MLKPAANDNAGAISDRPERPTVHIPRRGPDATYATSANVILPLRFARCMVEWRRPSRKRLR